MLVRSQWPCTTYPGICVYSLLIAGWMQKELAWAVRRLVRPSLKTEMPEAVAVKLS